MRNIRLGFAAGAALLIAAATVVSPVASAAEVVPESAAANCGFYRGFTGAYYKHCTSEPYAVKITIKYFALGRPDAEMCVQPNADEWLGWNDEVSNAYYNGKLC
ncbi:DUF6355 family natural product biosynthesis protein [Lentzea alba]|uniref:DUF6355 family natural product biosynthesis protein n=1 Tax=Lentzea alba TaxID=2714351 RepID=UPI0039BFC17F